MTIFFTALMSLTNFNILDSKSSLLKITNLDEIEALNPKFALMGYQSLYILCNFGTLWLTLIGLPFILLLIFVVLRIKRKWPVLQQRILDKIFFDFSLKFINEAFLIILVGVALNTFYY